MNDTVINILLIEDNPGDARLVQELLLDVRGLRFIIEHVDRVADGVLRLEAGGVDVVLLDLSLPDSFGLETFFRVRTQAPQVPIVVMTELDDESMAVRTVREGAQDYLVKDQVESTLLARTLRYAIERKAVTEQLRLQGKVLEAAANAIVITDVEGDITWVNPAFTKLTGYTLEEAVGQSPRLLKSGHQSQGFYEILWHTILAGEIWHGELINKRKDDTLYTEEMTITPVRNQLDEITHFVAVKQDVTQRKASEAALAWESGVNAAMAELSQALIRSASLEQISDLVLEQAKHLTSSRIGFVGYIDPRTGALVNTTMTRDVWGACDVEDKSVVFHTFGGLWGWVLQNRQSILTNDPSDDPRSVGVPDGHVPIKRFVSAPALIESDLVGQVALAGAERDYTSQDLDLVERLASLYALAIQSHRSREAIREMNVRLSLVNQISRRISGILEIDTLLDTVVDLVQSSLGYHHVGVALVQEDCVVPRAAAGNKKFVLEGHKFGLEDGGIVAWVATQGQVARVSDVREDARYLEVPGGAPSLSELAVPIQHGERILGVLNLESEELNAFDAGDESLVQAIADQLALALDNARLFQEVKVQRDEAMAVTETLFKLTDQVVSMNRVATALLASNDLDKVAQSFVVNLRDEMGIQKCGLWLVERDVVYLAASVGLSEAAVSQTWDHCPDFQKVIQTERHLTWRNFGAEACCDAYFDNWLMLSVKAHDEVLGVLVTEANVLEEDTLRMFVNQAALGLAAARAYRRLSDQAEILARTNAELARAIQAKTNLLNFMSHEVRNPLTAIIGFAKLLKKERVGSLNEKQVDFIERILSGSRHMANLVSEVLDLSKAEAGKLSLNLEPVSVSEICTDVVNMISGRIQEKDLRIDVDIADSALLVQSDPTRLRQILLNLLTNAIKFTPVDGLITVGAKAQHGPEGQAEVVLWVSDTGIGIKKEDFSKVFGEFDQIDDDRTSSEVGTGLGLPLTKELVELHGGRIWFESEYNVGTTFFVALLAA